MNIDKFFKKESTCKGIGISPGIAIAKAYILFRSDEINYAKKLDYDNIPTEIERFYKALEATRQNILNTKEKLNNELTMDALRIFDGQFAILNDPLFTGEIVDNIKSKMVNSEYSVKVTSSNWKNKLLKHRDPYFSERANDINEISNMLINELSQFNDNMNICFVEDVIIIADALSLSDISHLKNEKVLGFVTLHGGYTSHMAIVARALNIPCISMVGVKHDKVKSGDTIIIDGIRGVCIINPSKELVQIYEKEKEQFNFKLQQIENLIKLPSCSADGEKVKFQANIEIVEELPIIKKYNAEGIGLFRTEFLIDYSQNIPSQKAQLDYYQKVMDFCKDMPVTIRTFDVGGDKLISQFEDLKEKNPFLGWRAIRFQLAKKNILKSQLSAFLRSNKYGNLKIMFPMVSGVDEVIQLKEVLSEVEKDIIEEGLSINPYQFGIMVEIPSVALFADKFLPYVDFFSIGTNDLVQYTLAVDRGNDRVSYLYESLHPSIIRLINIFMESVKGKGKDVSICGEMCSDEISFIVLLILGIRDFSMVPWKIPVIKKLLSTIKLGELNKYKDDILNFSNAKEEKDFIKITFKDNLDSIRDFLF